jgi:hypothetical protein
MAISVAAASANRIGCSLGSPKNSATGTDTAARATAVTRPRSALIVNAVLYRARSGSCARTTTSSTPSTEKASIDCAKAVPRATRPKSEGANRRTRANVLTMPKPRVTTRQPIIQPAAFAVRFSNDG